MTLPTAPCTSCGKRVVYGQRRCLSCGATFDYGPTPPPEPSPAQVQEALQGAQAPPAVRPAAAPPGVRPALRSQEGAPVSREGAPVSREGAPVAREGGPSGGGLIDRGRYDEVAAGELATEAIPGFVDSTLFKAFTPAHVDVQAVEGLEQTAHEDDGAAPIAQEMLPVDPTSQAAVGEVATEAIPGFIDSTLFRAFTPAEVETDEVEGLEISPSAAASRARPKRGEGRASGEGQPCQDCGTVHERVVCPSCGARRRGG